MVRRFETLGQWGDHWGYVCLCAPDNFLSHQSGRMVKDPDQHALMITEFAELRSGMHFASSRLKDERLVKIVDELISMSLDFLQSGDSWNGLHCLHEARGLIWPMYKRRPKYAIEAERRVFGTNTIYEGMIASRFPCEGEETDLGPDQARLFEHARDWAVKYLNDRKSFRYMSWAIDLQGQLLRTSIEPRTDEGGVLKPLQRSSGRKQLGQYARQGAIRAFVVVGPHINLVGGLLGISIEQCGYPGVGIPGPFKLMDGKVELERFRFFLHDPPEYWPILT